LALTLLLAAGGVFAQDAALDWLKKEAASVKALSEEQQWKVPADKLAALHSALRDWIESRLPRTAHEFRDPHGLEATLQGELTKAGLIRPDESNTPAPEGAGWGWPGLGYADLAFQWFPELPDTLFVVAGVSVMCGVDDAVYMYHFDARGRTRVFEDHRAGVLGYSTGGVELSELDTHGRRLLLTQYTSVQCASTWMGMAYSVNRLSSLGDTRELLLSGEHGFWLQMEQPIVLKPDELIIELKDHSVDMGVHNRTHILRYNFAEGVHRVDPVALQPQDFVEEWLTQPWSEMQSRSDPKTKEWHDRLHGDYVFADYAGVIQCAKLPGRWLIALDVNQIGEKERSKPLESYFLVRELGDYGYRMEAVSGTKPSGCPGTGLSSDAGPASDKHPWLSEEELKALR
jgi:hypothetical protein